MAKKDDRHPELPDPIAQSNPNRFGWGQGEVFTIDDDGNKVRIGEVPSEMKEILERHTQQQQLRKETKDDAILFSARSNLVNVDDAIRHLADYKELYWAVRFPINKKLLSFPILGFIHITGAQVEYRATIENIVPFDPADYDRLDIKPEPWRKDWKENIGRRQASWKNELVITRIDPFSYETTSFQKYNGELVTLAPQKYIRVRLPDPEAAPPVQVQGKPVPEKLVEEVVLHHLTTIEHGLTLVGRQVATPAGRIDLLCKDINGTSVVIEIKKAQGTDQVLGQILRYMGWLTEHEGTEVRGIIIVQSRDKRLSFAIKAARNVQIKEFKMVFDTPA